MYRVLLGLTGMNAEVCSLAKILLRISATKLCVLTTPSGLLATEILTCVRRVLLGIKAEGKVNQISAKYFGSWLQGQP